MSRKYNIRWSEADNDDLAKAVKNFNAKITRLGKKYPKIKSALPEKVSVKQMKELIDTRQDLKRELNSLRRFSSKDNVIKLKENGEYEGIVTVPGSKYNLKTTKWQKEEMTRGVGYINKVRKIKAEQVLDIEMMSRGQKLGYTKGEIGMGSVDENALSPLNAFFKTMSRQDLNKRFMAIKMERQLGYWMKKELTLKQNVINGLLANYNSGKYKKDVAEILDAIDKMSFKQFYNRFMGETGVMEIVSPPPGSSMDDQLEQNLEALKSIWIPNYKK